jgi:small subunit ribosomal protein S1
LIGEPHDFPEMADMDEIQDMGELLDSMQPLKPLSRGDIVEGIVMRSDGDGILINIGHKSEGIVPPGEMRSTTREGVEPPKLGDEIVVVVMKGETGENGAILSIDLALGEKGWKVLEKAAESGEVLTGTILGFNRGGTVVEVEGVQGFVPMSQLISISRDTFRQFQQPPAPEATETTEVTAEAAEDGASEGEGETGGEVASQAEEKPPEPPEEPSENQHIGRDLKLKVLEVNRGRNRAILSERQAVQEQREERKSKLIEELREGEVRRGSVTGISSFGAFVDLGGADGLIHISELSWSPVQSPDEIVKIGQEVDVFVLRVDAVNMKIALSLKRLQPEPWETINEQFQVGDMIDATITKLTDFGAFARVKNSVEGLIHISELTSRMIQHPREVVQEGDDVRLKILRIEPERRRLALSLLQSEGEGY